MIKLGIAGYSGSGKTTLLTELIPALRAQGLKVSTVKHTHHNVALDRRGDDSRDLMEAGAVDVMLASDARWALLHELRGSPEPEVDALSARMAAVDLLLIEGFKRQPHDKIEVHRPATGKPLLHPDDPHVIAIATDAPEPDSALPQLDLNDVAGIAGFIVKHYGLGGEG